MDMWNRKAGKPAHVGFNDCLMQCGLLCGGSVGTKEAGFISYCRFWTVWRGALLLQPQSSLSKAAGVTTAFVHEMGRIKDLGLRANSIFMALL